MNHFARISVLFFIVAAWCHAAVAPTQLAIDGVFAGWVVGFEGGDPRGNVVVDPPIGSAVPKKHISGVRYAPITFEISYPLSPPVLNWIMDLYANRSSRRTLLLLELDYNYKLTSSLEALNASLTEVRFPIVSAASKEARRVTLVITPESTKVPAVVPKVFTAPASTTVTGSNFKFSIDGLPTGLVSQIESFTIKQRVASAPPEFSNLIITARISDAAAWYAWRDNFFAKGLNDDSSEKSASLLLFGNVAGAVPVLEFQFRNVGMVRVVPEPIAPGDDGIKRFQAELYYETIALVPAPLVALTTLPIVTATPAGGATGTAPTGAMPVLGTPIGTVPTVSPTREAGALVGVTSPADQGGRDPQNFPRLEGTVRKSYSSIQQKTSLQEMVAYTMPEPLESIEKSYTQALAAGGWELGTRYENNDAVGRMHQIILNWKNALRTVAITLTEVKAGGSEIGVNLTTKI
jgi:hypothetical protein